MYSQSQKTIMLLTPPSSRSFQLPLQSEERRLHFYEKGEEIPLVEQGIWLVNRGVLQLFKMNSQGEETVLGWSQTGNFFGLWFTSLDSFQVKALSDVYLQWFALTEIEQDPILAQKMLFDLVTRVRQTEELLAIATLKRVEERLGRLLKLLGLYLGEKKENSIRIKVRFTHQNLASTIGTTRVTVTRLLGEMQKQKLITLDSTRHLVLLSEQMGMKF